MKKFIGYYRKCDLLTMTGTICSFVGLIMILKNHYTISVLFMLLSGLCDAFDGRLARKYKYNKSQQTYGVELDSLSDVICFGFFPAALTSALSNSIVSLAICAFYLLCGVIRLAYFNMLSITNEAKKNTYIGLPITSVAIVYPVVMLITRMINFNLLKYVLPVLLLILGICFISNFEMKKPDIGKILKKIFNKHVINFIIFPIFILVFSDLIFKLNATPFNIKTVLIPVFGNFKVFILFTTFIASLILLLTAIFNNSKVSKMTMLIITLVILGINDIKYTIMGTPLEFSDINYLNPDNMKMMTTATTSIGLWIFKVIIKLLIVGIIGFIIIKLDKEHKEIFKTKKIRIISLIVSIIFIILPLITFSKTNFILKNIYNIENKDKLNSKSVFDIYNEYGFYQGMYLNEISKQATRPEGYTEEKVETALEMSDNAYTKGTWQKSNVVFILSEAFSDIQNIEEITFNKSLTPNIDDYKDDKDKMVMDLLVPSFGGVSVNTEFEILTGSSLTFMKTAYIPYTQYYNDETGKKAPNIIKEFNNNGYETMYLTPWGQQSYKSEYVYGLFGADKKVYGDSLNGKLKGEYYSDESLMKDIYNELKTTSIGNYKFIMSATGQNHYPYTGEKYDNYDIAVTSTKYNEEDTAMLKAYAQGVYDADKELNNLYNYIQKINTPTIVVFYGDHLPYTVDTAGYNPYLESEYFNTESLHTNQMRTYTTKAVILANYDLETEDIDYIKASYLGAYVLNKMDLDVSNYFKFIDYTREIIPVFNREAVYINSSFTEISNLTGIEKDALNNYKYVQHKYFYEQ